MIVDQVKFSWPEWSTYDPDKTEVRFKKENQNGFVLICFKKNLKQYRFGLT
jgi:Uma2 family endonuclease